MPGIDSTRQTFSQQRRVLPRTVAPHL
jgi:hypothetical protein